MRLEAVQGQILSNVDKVQYVENWRQIRPLRRFDRNGEFPSYFTIVSLVETVFFHDLVTFFLL